jgi:HlyD family secretion protein
MALAMATNGPSAAPPSQGLAVQAIPAALHPSHTKPSRWRNLRWAVPVAVAGVLAAGGARIAASRSATPVHYETAAVDRGNIDAKVTATGTVSAIVMVQVGSQVSGRIEKLFVDFSSPVRKGQVVATIDPALFKAAEEQARANCLAAQGALEKVRAAKVQADRQFVRVRELQREGLASLSDLDVAEAASWAARADVDSATATIVQARATLDQAALNLGYTTIVSPIDGIVISRNVDVGQTVAAALQAPTLFTIAQDLTKMQVDTNVAEADVGKLREGMDVTFTVDAYPNRPFPGRVRQVRDAATTVQNVVTYDAVIDFDNAQRLLKPGMTASVTFVYAERGDVLRLPNAALRFKPDAATMSAMTGGKGGKVEAMKGDDRWVWVLRGGHAVSERVKVGISDGSATEVTAGDLREGDLAITEANADAAGKH